MKVHNLLVTGSLTSGGENISTISSSVSTTVTELSSSLNGRLDSIQTSTGSLNTFTSSANNRLNSIESVTGSYATTGSNTFNGNLTVTGFIDAQELRTTYISSSILYRSGSTKFGDELTDTHAFTGSMLLSGSLTVNGASTIQNTLTLNGSNNVIRSGNELRFNRTDNAVYTRLYDAGSLAANGFILDNINGEGFHFQNNGTTIMRMNSSGNIGINRNNPTRTLDILGATGIGTLLKLEGASGTTTYLQLAYNGATNAQSGYIGYNSSSQLLFFTNDTLALTIDSNRNVGIGTSSPAGNLQVASSSSPVIAMNLTGSATSGPRGDLAWYNSSISTVALIRATAVTDNVGTQLEFYTRPAAGSLTQALTLASTGAATFSSSVTASGGFEIPNGQFYRARRTSGNLLTDMIGIPSGTNDVRVVTTGAFQVISGGLTTFLNISDTGVATFSSSVTANDTVTVNTSVTPLRFGNLIRWGFQRPGSDNRYISFMRNMDATATPVWTVDGDNGNVGIGTASPSANLHVIRANDGGSGTPGVILRTDNGANDIVRFQDGTTIVAVVKNDGSIGIGTPTPTNKLHLTGASSTPSLRLGSTSVGFHWDIGRENQSTGDFVFNSTNVSTGTTEKMRITQDSVAYLRMASGTGGIQFNGDTAAANALDDYEEGSFTPSSLGTNFSSISVVFGRYIKIGNQVTIHCRWTVTPGSTGMKYVVFDLPFAFVNNSNVGFTGAVSNYNEGQTAGSSNVGTTVRNSSGSTTQQYVEAYYTSTNVSSLFLSMTYFTFF